MIKLVSENNGIAIYELKNDHLRVRVMNLGAHLLSVFAKDRNGEAADVVLGLGDLSDYFRDGDKFGAVIGRVGNRIGGAQFDLNGTTYHLFRNNGENTIHGGKEGFDKKLFSHEIIRGEAVRFIYRSPDGEEGFPGNLTLTVTYRLEADTLTIRYEAVSDQDTLLNVTNHAYFNLAGVRPDDLSQPGGEDLYAAELRLRENILGHKLKIDADYVADCNEERLPTGRYLPVKDSAFDFREFRLIGEHINDDDALLKMAKGYDAAFILNRQSVRESGAPRIVLLHPDSGRQLEITTDMPTVQVYSGNWLGGALPGKYGVTYRDYDGVALETEYLPDSIHVEDPSPAVLNAGEEFCSETSYRFTVIR